MISLPGRKEARKMLTKGSRMIAVITVIISSMEKVTP